MTRFQQRTPILARVLAVAALTVAQARPAAAAPPATDSGPQRSPGAAASLGMALMAGVTAPHDVEAGPSFRALVLYQPLRALGFGVTGQLARHHWRAAYSTWGTPGSVEADLTTGFVGAAGRWTIVPDWVVSPLVEIDLGVAMQGQSGSNFSCNAGAYPGGQLGVGARAQLARAWSIFAMASASTGIKGEQCGVADGPPVTPFAAWGYGMQIGAGFDLGLGAGPARNLAVR